MFSSYPFPGYLFWSIFFGIGPMVMFFPMVKLAIDGYEVLILSLASPIILSSSLINNLAEVTCLCSEVMPLNFFYFSHYLIECSWKTVDTTCGGHLFTFISN